MKYKTEQRTRLFDFLQAHADRPFNIEALARAVSGISRSAIYRNINALVEEGVVRRFQEEGGKKFLYQYIGSAECRAHFHLKCSACGSILHMDAAASQRLTDFVGESADFHLDKSKTMLFGHCASCQ